jgi:hypothetical protein
MKAKRKPATKAKRQQGAPNAPTPEFYRKLCEAFRHQESDISDLVIMAELTARASVDGDEGERIFTAHHLLDMIEEFKRTWHNSHKAAESKGA